MLKKWKRSVDSGKAFGALLTDLSKALHCLDHELLTSKLNTYGFSLPALRLVYDYLLQRRRRTRVSNPYSEWLAVMYGVRKAQLWDHFYPTFFLANLFLTHSVIDITNFADDNTPNLSAKNVEDVIESLERVPVQVI